MKQQTIIIIGATSGIRFSVMSGLFLGTFCNFVAKSYKNQRT